jgi:hypothetical protein
MSRSAFVARQHQLARWSEADADPPGLSMNDDRAQRGVAAPDGYR